MKTRSPIVLLLLAALAGCSAVAALTGPSGSCQGPKPYTVGSTASDKLGANECSGPGDMDGHLYTLALTEQSDFAVTMTPTGFEGAVGIWTAAGQVVFQTNGSGSFGAKAFLPTGQYTLVAGRHKIGGGSYSLGTAPTTVAGCADSGPGRGAWTIPGVVIAGAVTSIDCAGNGTAKQDIYSIWLAAGQSITVVASMSQIGNVNVNPAPGTTGPDVSKSILKGGSASLTYTATNRGAYNVHVLSDLGFNPSPTYTLSIN